LSNYFDLLFGFPNIVWASASGAFRIVSDGLAEISEPRLVTVVLELFNDICGHIS